MLVWSRHERACKRDVIPAKRTRFNLARASRDPGFHRRRECTKRVDYWIPALGRRAKPGSVGQNDN